MTFTQDMDNTPSYISSGLSHASSELSEKQKFAQLREQIRCLESPVQDHRVSSQLPALDNALSGGLRFGHTHLICSHFHDASATGFTIAWLDRIMAQDPNATFIWCAPSYGGMQGRISAEGLAWYGLSPAHFIFVHEQHPMHLMAACEEALQTHAVAAVICEYGVAYQKADKWQRWSRRLKRAARTSGVLGFMIGADAPACGFETKWQVRSCPDAPSSASSAALQAEWHPSWQVDLCHAVRGRPYQARLIWNRTSHRFYPGSAHHPVSANSTDLPAFMPSGQDRQALSA